MSKHGQRHASLRISGTGMPGCTTVELDGQDISAVVTGVALRMSLGEEPTAVLDLVVHDLSTDVAETHIVLPPAARDLLVRLGWTPPQDAAEGGEG